MNLKKEEAIFSKHLFDLANKACNNGICLYSNFQNLNEQSIFLSIKNELPKINYLTYGGFENAERKILCFCGNNSINNISNMDFPITCIRVSPLNMKFSDKLTHRDFLGAVLSLGIERNKIGDIISSNNTGYIFCFNSIADFIVDQLNKVKHTIVSASLVDMKDFHYEPPYKEISRSVSSERLDNILSTAFNLSRSKITDYITGGKVYVNSRLVISNSHILNENDIVSVRGLGKIKYVGITGMTKKGRYSVVIQLFTA